MILVRQQVHPQYLIFWMNAEFIDSKHRENVCGIKLEEAYHLYRQYNCNLQTAISFKLGLISPSHQRHSSSVVEVASDQQGEGQFEHSDYQFDEPYQKYQLFVKNGKPFFKKYPLKITDNQISNYVFSTQQDVKFKLWLQKKLISKIETSFKLGQIEEGLVWSWKQSFPIGILLVNHEDESIKQMGQIVCNPDIAKKINTFFRVYAINSSEKKLPKWFNSFIDEGKDTNSFVVLRVNYVDQVEVLTKIKCGQPEQFMKKIIAAKSQSIQRQMDEKHIIKQYLFTMEGKFYQRPPSMKQKLKIKQDQKIRRQQDEDFYRMAKSVKHIQSQKKIKAASISPLELKKQRQLKRAKINIYSEGMNLKLRVPSGKSLLLKVNPQDCIQYLFDVIDSQIEDIGFENDEGRRFDIMYGDQKNQCLSSKKQNQIKDVIEQFELLVVKEIFQ